MQQRYISHPNRALGTGINTPMTMAEIAQRKTEIEMRCLNRQWDIIDAEKKAEEQKKIEAEKEAELEAKLRKKIEAKIKKEIQAEQKKKDLLKKTREAKKK